MASSSSRRGKRVTPIERHASPSGCISDEEKQSNFICFLEFKEVIRHKFLSLLFFHNEGFMFQEWLIYQGLAKLIEMDGDYYPYLARSGNHVQLTTEDVFLLHALRAKLPTNWISIISDHMAKITKQKVYHLPYPIFISKVLRHHDIDFTNEVSLGCSKKSMIEKLALHHMGFRKN
ncbi:hypothetical protein V8G54_001044 [Vigna mungo]|uniref:Uncharacterized protein n=1 Tax=Vigna mungo TaxID=3915 RepID=A0AAQ3P6D3_VIGMU